MAAAGLILAGRGTGLGLIIGGAALALAAGFANAKLHTEMARAPMLAKEMRGVTVKGFVELYERRDKAKARITPAGDRARRTAADNAIACATLSAANATVESGEAVSLRSRSRAATRRSRPTASIPAASGAPGSGSALRHRQDRAP